MEETFESKIRRIIDDPEMFPGPKKVAVMKAIVDEKCYLTPKRRRKLGEEEAEAKIAKCKKHKLGRIWGQFLIQKQPVAVGDLTVQIYKGEIKIEKEKKEV